MTLSKPNAIQLLEHDMPDRFEEWLEQNTICIKDNNQPTATNRYLEDVLKCIYSTQLGLPIVGNDTQFGGRN